MLGHLAVSQALSAASLPLIAGGCGGTAGLGCPVAVMLFLGLQAASRLEGGAALRDAVELRRKGRESGAGSW
jgi:hypothetical protein